MTMCNIMSTPMCFNVGTLRWVSIWGLGKHVHSATFFMYKNHIISNNYNELCSLLMVCS